jgi:sulfatase modifying factor 1
VNSLDLYAQRLSLVFIFFVMTSVLGFVFYRNAPSFFPRKREFGETTNCVISKEPLQKELKGGERGAGREERSQESLEHFEKRYQEGLEQGQKALERKDFSEAKRIFQELKVKFPREEIQQVLGEIEKAETLQRAYQAKREGQLEVALQYFQQSLRLSDKKESALEEQVLQLELKIQQEHLESQNQRLFEELRDQAHVAVRNQEWDEALEKYKQAQELQGLSGEDQEQVAKIRKGLEEREEKERFEERVEKVRLLTQQHFFQGIAELRLLEKEYAMRFQRFQVLRSFRYQLYEAHFTDLLVEVPAGTYRIGSREAKDEEPEQEVEIERFWMDRIPVTNEYYALFIEDIRYPPPPYWKGSSFPEGQNNFPVVEVSFQEAQAFARWAKKRLATEYEWEAAARTLKGLRFPWGNEVRLQASNFSPSRFEGLCAVTQFGASVGGFWDLVGNASQWTSSLYRPYSLSDSLSSENQKASGFPSVKEYYSIRGGNFLLPVEQLRCSNRSYESPQVRLPTLGFRCVRSFSLKED